MDDHFKGDFEKIAGEHFDFAFKNIGRKMEGKEPLPTPEHLKYLKKWYKYKCIKTHEYTWSGQDIHNGKHYSFEKDKEYDWAESPNLLGYIAQHPEYFELINEWTELK